MTAYRSIRIRMADRPGALSAIGAALAANRVDIVRLDVVSHDDGFVVDDLLLRAVDPEAINLATRSFYGDVEVFPLSGFTQDPVTGMARGIARVAGAANSDATAAAVVAGVPEFMPCDAAALLGACEDGGYALLAGPIGLGSIAANDPFEFRALQSPREMRAEAGWAPPQFAERFGGSRIAALPLGNGLLLLVGRLQPLKFHAGELDRLVAFAQAVTPMLGALSVPPAVPVS